jgi:hypothetical protein
MNKLILKFLGRKSQPKTRKPTPPSVTNPTKNIGCTEFEVNGWELSDFVIKTLVPVVGTHPFPLQELMLMAGAVCRYQPPIVFEWGTHIGKSARIFHETLTHYSIKSVIHSIDLPDDASHVEHPGAARGQLVQGLPGITLHQGDGVNTALQLWENHGKPERCLFFVDGDHEYESVKRELHLILATVSRPVILAHDTFYQSCESGYNIDPHRAVTEAVAQLGTGCQVVHSGISLPGMTLVVPE